LRKKRILIVHGFETYPLRATIRDLLYCYENYLENSLCFYLNLNSAFDIPKYILKVNYDLIIFHTVFLSARWKGTDFFKKNIIEKCIVFEKYSCPKLILSQDEWIHTNLLNEFVNKIGITHIGSNAGFGEWHKIYNQVDFKKVKFKQILTGYIDNKVIELAKNVQKKWVLRSNDIGYRAYKAPPWLGRHGYLKTKIANVFKEEGEKNGFNVNISINESDTITGNDWYRFLGDCKFFIGVEGGSTIIDPDGLIWNRGTEYLKKTPDASFDEIEKEVFPSMDGNLWLVCISPRHLEAIATNTCQVLVEGEYNGFLKPDRHYIPVKKDFSNLDEVFSKMRDTEFCDSLLQNAYSDIVLNEKYTYRGFLSELSEFVFK